MIVLLNKSKKWFFRDTLNLSNHLHFTETTKKASFIFASVCCESCFRKFLVYSKPHQRREYTFFYNFPEL